MSRISKRLLRFWVALNNFMTVPLWSALLSLCVACIEPLKHALEVHLYPINGAIDRAGKCAVPMTLVVLGAYFYVPPPEGADQSKSTKRKLTKKDKREMSAWQYILHVLHISNYKRSATPEEDNTPKPKPGETKTVMLAILARMVITPILLVPIMVLATKFDWHKVFDE